MKIQLCRWSFKMHTEQDSERKIFSVWSFRRILWLAYSFASYFKANPNTQEGVRKCPLRCVSPKTNCLVHWTSDCWNSSIGSSMASMITQVCLCHWLVVHQMRMWPISLTGYVSHNMPSLVYWEVFVSLFWAESQLRHRIQTQKCQKWPLQSFLQLSFINPLHTLHT